MDIDKILYIDCRKQENKKKLQNYLHTIPKYKNIKGDVPLDMLEKMLYLVTDRYAVTVQWISYICEGDNSRYWSCSLRDDSDYSFITTITAVTVYEVFAKLAICLYALVKGYKGGIETKEKVFLDKQKKMQN